MEEGYEERCQEVSWNHISCLVIPTLALFSFWFFYLLATLSSRKPLPGPSHRQRRATQHTCRLAAVRLGEQSMFYIRERAAQPPQLHHVRVKGVPVFALHEAPVTRRTIARFTAANDGVL